MSTSTRTSTLLLSSTSDSKETGSSTSVVNADAAAATEPAETDDNAEDSKPNRRNIEVAQSIHLPFPREVAYDAFSDLSRQPTWSTWLRSVELVPDQPGHTKWTMKFMGLSYSWISVSDCAQRPSVIKWESISGLKNYGVVRFRERDNDQTEMTMQMTFVAPRAVSALFRRSKRIASVVEEKMIRTTMVNFRDIVLDNDYKEFKEREGL